MSPADFRNRWPIVSHLVRVMHCSEFLKISGSLELILVEAAQRNPGGGVLAILCEYAGKPVFRPVKDRIGRRG